MDKMGRRKGALQTMSNIGSRIRLEFLVPSRGLFGYKSEFMTDTRGEGVMHSVFEEYDRYKGEISRRLSGSIIAYETGESTAYGLYNAEPRGALFIGAGVPVYAGMVVGECSKSDDLVINVNKRKQLTNMRSSGADDSLRLTPHRNLSLEACLEFIGDDELLEVTPQSVRIRKRVLQHTLRKI
jgi:GTP-binding protein